MQQPRQCPSVPVMTGKIQANLFMFVSALLISTQQAVNGITEASNLGFKLWISSLENHFTVSLTTDLLPASSVEKTSLLSSRPTFPLCLQVYHLASVRLRDLCWKLDISSDLRGRIWTCFEHTLIHCTELMKGRHLDQLLLCSVYIMSKVRKQTSNQDTRPKSNDAACQFAHLFKVR